MKKSIILIALAFMTIGSYANEVTRVFLWKDGQVINQKLITRDSTYEYDPYQGGVNIPGLGNWLTPVDSIVWQPYQLESVWMASADTVPVVTQIGEVGKMYEYPIHMGPDYATFTYSMSNSNPSVASVKMLEQSFNEMRSSMGRNYRLIMEVTPQAVGKTVVTVTFDKNRIQKQFELVVTERPGVQDETSISIDSLFNKIYSRLYMTGNIHPDGYADFNTENEGETGFSKDLIIMQDLCADQLYWIWPDPGVFDLVKTNINAENPIISAFFHRLYFNIWMCNSYLTRTEGQDALAEKRAEIRFLRAYFYYYLLDMFGNVPVVTDNTLFTTTPQSSRKQLYQFVESELLAAEQDLAAHEYKPDYYRVDKVAAWLLLSRLYLNGEVYAGEADYTKAAQYAYKVINSSYELASQYRWLFMGDNDQKSTINDAWKEMILPVRQEGASTASWNGSLYHIASMATLYSPEVGISAKWQCTISRAQLVDLFFADPLNAVQGTANELTVAANDLRARFCNSYNDYTWEYNAISGTDYSTFGGWAIQKWSNLTEDPAYEITSDEWPETDIPLLRKAEAYLNYAEAVLRGGQLQNNLTALEAVNSIRNRASAPALYSVSLDEILNERGREFYAEGYRRSDLIRFGKFGGNTGYTWEWKGGARKGADFPAYMNLYPIPSAYLQGMPQGVQNEGY